MKCPEQLVYRIARVSPPVQCRTCGRHAIPHRYPPLAAFARGEVVRVLILEHYPYDAGDRKRGARG